MIFNVGTSRSTQDRKYRILLLFYDQLILSHSLSSPPTSNKWFRLNPQQAPDRRPLSTSEAARLTKLGPFVDEIGVWVPAAASEQFSRRRGGLRHGGLVAVAQWWAVDVCKEISYRGHGIFCRRRIPHAVIPTSSIQLNCIKFCELQ